MLLLAIAAGASVVVLLVIQSGLTFFQDEWNFVIHRQEFNADAFFLPNDVHPAPLVAAVYKLCLAVFGMTSVGPERVVSVVVYAVTAILLFVYVRKRIGDWLALFPAVLLLFLGPAWNDLLWPFEFSLVGSVAAGLGTLLALEREDRTGDALACFLLVVATACSSLGIPFALASGVDILLKRRSRGLARLYVPAVPLALYALWYLTYGHKVPSAITLTNIANTPLFVAESVSSSLSSLVGLNPRTPSAQPIAAPQWGTPLLIAVIVLTALWLRHRPRVLPQIWVVATAALAFWVLDGFDFVPGREPSASRYQYIGVVFIVLILAELYRGVHLRPRWLLIIGGLSALAFLSNLVPLKDGLAQMEGQSELARGELAAIEIARDTVSPQFSLTPQIAATATLVPIDAGSFLSAVDAHGSPAAPVSELPSLSAGVRREVDIVLVHALSVRLVTDDNVSGPGTGPAPSTKPASGVRIQGSCLRIATGAAHEGISMALQGTTSFRISSGTQPVLGLWRFSNEPVLESKPEAGSTSVLRIPRDRSNVLWQGRITGDGSMTICSHV